MGELSRSETIDRTTLLKALYEDRPLAHAVLFKHRRPNKTPAFHEKMINDFHNLFYPRVLMMSFRGSAKSTIAEEAMLLMAGFREFSNGLIIGETETRAQERLRAIKHEVESNELLLEVFGDLQGPTWSEGELILSNGVRLLAMGRGQAIRGVKHNDMRPDAVFCDDLESKEIVANKDLRLKTIRWFWTDLLPACSPEAVIRVAATPLDPDALAVRLTREPEWTVHTYPITHLGPQGETLATWPDRFPLSKVANLRSSFLRQGLLREFTMEYMCQVTSAEDRSFTQDMFRIEPQVRTWQAVYAMFDPARTTNVNSATTGYACWSWIGNRLVVWDSWARQLMPDAIVAAVFDCALDTGLRPTLIGVEEDGLNEFLMQPLRQEQSRRGVTIPLKAMRAPKGKFDFIRGLQPFFKAREVMFAKPLPDLAEQLMGFPTGNIDAPNALAYALKMRPGAAIYEDFGSKHLMGADIRPSPQVTLHLAMNATANCVTGVLLQYSAGVLRVFADWVMEGDVATGAAEIVTLAKLFGAGRVSAIGGPLHFNQHNNVGLRQSLARIPAELIRGGNADEGRAVIREHLQRESRGVATLQVSETATWTLNGFAGGYARGIDKRGVISGTADEGPYRVLLEGLESFAAVLRVGMLEDDETKNYGYTPSGQKYLSARR